MNLQDERKLIYENEILKHGFNVVIKLLENGILHDDVLEIARRYVKESKCEYVPPKIELPERVVNKVSKINGKKIREREEIKKSIGEIKHKILKYVRIKPRASSSLIELIDVKYLEDFHKAANELIDEERITRFGGGYNTEYRLR